jgi:hypothetical protein
VAGVANNSPLQIRTLTVSSPPANNTGGLPSNPGVVNATAALQAVFTLNITNASGLDLLLAALLDNSTDGMNGSFQTVTWAVPSLGLERPVVEGLANGSISSDGLYGAPRDTYREGSGGFLLLFWNAVTSTVVEIGVGVVSLLQLAWNGVVATYTYMREMGRLAEILGGVIERRLPGVLVSVGRDIIEGLQDFISWLAKLIRNELSASINSVKDAASNYDMNIVASMNLTVNDVENHREVSVADSMALFSALGGDILELALAVGIVVAIVLTLLPGFSVIDALASAAIASFFTLALLSIPVLAELGAELDVDVTTESTT